MPKLTLAAPILVLCGLALASPARAQGADTPPDIVADQIRSQGFTCDTAESATRDEGDTTPGEQAWILTCSNATYRVKFVPDQAAHVEQID